MLQNPPKHNAEHIIKPGMFASVQMTIAENKDAITVPTNAILKDDSGQYIFTLDESKAKRTRVKTGIELLERTEILSGLTEDEIIITVGQQFVKDGEQVVIQN